MKHYTAEELAQKAKVEIDRSDDTQAAVADHIGVDASAVSHALKDKSTRRIKTLAKILRLYGWTVRTKPAFAAEKPDTEEM